MKKIVSILSAILLFCTMINATKIKIDQSNSGHFINKQATYSNAQRNNLASITVDFAFSNGCAGDSVQFINTSKISGDTFFAFLWKFGDSTSSIIRADPKHKYLKPGIYSVWLFALTYGGLKDSVNKIITVNSIPATPIITQNGNALNSSSSSGNQWYDSTGAISGDTSQSFMPTKKGYYWVIVTINGCSSNNSDKIFFNPLLINEENNFDRILVYPNPNNGIFYIQNNSTENLLVSINIYNAIGELVSTKDLYPLIANGSNRYDFTDEQNGMYYLVIQYDKGILIKNILLSK